MTHSTTHSSLSQYYPRLSMCFSCQHTRVPIQLQNARTCVYVNAWAQNSARGTCARRLTTKALSLGPKVPVADIERRQQFTVAPAALQDGIRIRFLHHPQALQPAHRHLILRHGKHCTAIRLILQTHWQFGSSYTSTTSIGVPV